jgi:4-diphosphocytidyl-2-C-methyl-D-erythritol kinase
MISFPACKINLGLHVLHQRRDGFHNIETVFYPVQWNDALEIIEYKGKRKVKVRFRSVGLPIDGPAQHNLCLRAYHLLDDDFDLPPVNIILQKNIPMGAGLGGGSSDAAAVIRLLNQMCELRLTIRQQERYAARLGSDCAFFIQSLPALASGRGERLKHIPLSLDGWHIAVVHPGIHVSTAQAYAGVEKRGTTSGDEKLEQIIRQPASEWSTLLQNDFEKTVFAAHPTIHNLKEKMYEAGAVYAAMSGSGSAVFGLFAKSPKLPASLKKMKHYIGTL